MTAPIASVHGVLGPVAVDDLGMVLAHHRLAHYGEHGYDHMLTNLRPWMLWRGFRTQSVEDLLLRNPARFLIGSPPGGERPTTVQADLS